MNRFSLVCLSVLFPVLCASAQEAVTEADTLRGEIEGLTVTGNLRRTPKLMKGQGEVEWDMALMDDLPKILGNADPMHYLP